MKKPKKLPRDRNQLAHAIVLMSTEEPEELSNSNGKPPEEPTPERSPISEYLATIGRKGGLKGGPARKEKLSNERRKEIAQKAAQSRWHNKKDK